MNDKEEQPVDFDLLLFDHVASQEPKLLNKMYSATQRAIFEQKRRSSGKFKSLKEVVGEYNKIVSRKRAATDSSVKIPAAKKQARRGEVCDSTDSSDSDEHPVKTAAKRLLNRGTTKRAAARMSSSSDSDVEVEAVKKKPKSTTERAKSAGKAEDTPDSNSSSDEPVLQTRPVAGKLKQPPVKTPTANSTAKKTSSSDSDSSSNEPSTKKVASMRAKKVPQVAAVKAKESESSSSDSDSEEEPLKKQQPLTPVNKPTPAAKETDSSEETSDTSDTELKTAVPVTTRMAQATRKAPSKGTAEETSSSSDSSDSQEEAPKGSVSVAKNNKLAAKVIAAAKAKKKESSSDSSSSESGGESSEGKMPHAKKLSNAGTETASVVRKSAAVSKMAKEGCSEERRGSDDGMKGKYVPVSMAAVTKVTKVAKKTSSSSSESDSGVETVKRIHVMQSKPATALKQTAKAVVAESSDSSSDSSDSNQTSKVAAGETAASVGMRKTAQIQAPAKKGATSNKTPAKKAALPEKKSSSSPDSSDSDVFSKKHPQKTSPASVAAVKKDKVSTVNKAQEKSSCESSDSEVDEAAEGKNVVTPVKPSVKSMPTKRQKGGSSSDSTFFEDAMTKRVSTEAGNKVPVAQKIGSLAASGKSSSEDMSPSSDEEKSATKTQPRRVSPKRSVSAAKEKKADSLHTSDSSSDSDEKKNSASKVLGTAKKEQLRQVKGLQGGKKPLAAEMKAAEESSCDSINNEDGAEAVKPKHAKSVSKKSVVASNGDSCSDDSSVSETPAKTIVAKLQGNARKIITLKAKSGTSEEDSKCHIAAMKPVKGTRKVTSTFKIAASKKKAESSSSESSSESDESTKKSPPKGPQVVVVTKAQAAFAMKESNEQVALTKRRVATKKSGNSPSEDSSDGGNQLKKGPSNCVQSYGVSSVKKATVASKESSTSSDDSSGGDVAIGDKSKFSGKERSEKVQHGDVKGGMNGKAQPSFSNNISNVSGAGKVGLMAESESEKTPANGDGVAAENTDSGQRAVVASGERNSSNKRKSNEPFRRVQISKDQLDEKFRDNSYKADFDEWGKKAYKDFSKVQGKGYRHEKTKKKRGSYGGGHINTAVNSVKFDDSE